MERAIRSRARRARAGQRPALVAVEPASCAARPALEAMYRAYLDELSAFSAEVEIGATLQEEWFEGDEEIRAFVVLVDGRPVGFQLVLAGELARTMSADADYWLHDFFVTGGVRGTGVAEAAARLLFRRLRGRWALCWLPRNARAAAFWTRVVGAHGAGVEADRHAEGHPMLRFRV